MAATSADVEASEAEEGASEGVGEADLTEGEI